MSVNVTAAYLEARTSPVLICFSKIVGDTSTYLDGAGGVGADGFPLPLGGRLRSLRVYDGSTLRSAAYDYELSPGDRISVYASWIPGDSEFAVTVQVNGTSTMLSVSGIESFSTLLATVYITLKETD